MKDTKRSELEARGYKVYDHAGDAVGMTEEEKALLDARIEMALAVRRLREAQSMTQKDLATRLKTSQPRVARLERAAADVSFDQMIRAYAAIGGLVHVKRTEPLSSPVLKGKSSPAKKTRKGTRLQIELELAQGD